MKIIIITREEPFYVPRYLKKLLKNKHNDIVHVFVNTSPSPYLSKWDIFRMSNPVAFVLQSIQYIVFKFLDNFHMKNGDSFHSVGQMLKYYNISFDYFDTWRKDHFFSKIKSLNPDLLVSVANSKIISSDILKLFKKGAINVHGSLLPQYRGIMAYFWVLLNEEKYTGVSVHFMDEQFDNGDIIEQEIIPIEKNETIHSLLLKISTVGSGLILSAVGKIETGNFSPIKNDRTEATVFLKPSRAQIEAFRKKKRFF